MVRVVQSRSSLSPSSSGPSASPPSPARFRLAPLRPSTRSTSTSCSSARTSGEGRSPGSLIEHGSRPNRSSAETPWSSASKQGDRDWAHVFAWTGERAAAHVDVRLSRGRATEVSLEVDEAARAELADGGLVLVAFEADAGGTNPLKAAIRE